MNNELMPFEGKGIRKILHNEEWYFSIIDVVEVLTDSPQPSSYWNKVKKTLLKESQSLPFWQRLKVTSNDGKKYLTDCANTEGVLRIVMSVPSPKAEPLKLWLAEQGKRTIDETENPELLTERQAELYRAKGYPDDWILRRVQTIEIRKQLTDEWKNRGVIDSKEFSILTATIAKGTFGVTPTEHAQFKGLEKENLRDHMTPLELIFTALGEELAKQNAIKDDAQGFHENHEAAQKGGYSAGEARKRVEDIEGKKVVSKENFKNLKGNDKGVLPESDDKVA